MRKPVSVTLENDNLLWLRGKARATERGSLSAVLDGIVTEARLKGRTPLEARSVRGTITLDPDDLDLKKADAYVQSLFDDSLARPIYVRERPPTDPKSRAKRRRG